ncbi:FAD:protein FMN transferase [Gemmatimonadota bacterium]
MQEESRIARKLSALEDMGLERLDSSSVVTHSTPLADNSYKVCCSRPAMGTLVTVTALGTSSDQIEDAIGNAFQEMDRLVALLSRYESSSAVCCLNAQGRMRGLHPEFSRLVSRSLQFHEMSGGAFDISVEPIVDLFRHRLDAEDPVEPSRSEIAEVLELVGSRHIELTSNGVGFQRSGMSVSLNGIAKGYIVDAIAKVLEAGGIEDYLIDAGGDVRVGGTKEEGLPWTVAVQDPSKNDRFPDTIHLTDAAVATAGCYEKNFDCASRFHHIINSDTGLSPQVNLSVSVVALSAMVADALATGVFVMQPHMGVRFVEALRGCECLIVDRSGRILKSTGWQSAAPNNGEKAEL